MLISLLEVCQEGEVKKGGTWRTLRFPDRRHGGQGHPWQHGWCFFTLRKIPWKFRVDIFIRSVSGMGGQEGGYLEEVEGSWPETWRTGLSMTLWMYLVDPKNHILKVSCHYLYFRLKYKHMSRLSQNVTDIRQTYRHSGNLYKTSISGRYAPFILAPAEGC